MQLKAEASAGEYLQEHGSLTSDPKTAHPMETEGPANAEAEANQDEVAPDGNDNAVDGPSNTGEV